MLNVNYEKDKVSSVHFTCQSFLHILTSKRKSARKLLCQSVGETQRDQMTTSKHLYRFRARMHLYAAKGLMTD